MTVSLGTEGEEVKKMSEHTPGPWELFSDGYAHIITGPKDQPVAELDISFENEFERSSEISESQALANARLMASALELLEGLKALRDFMWSEGYADQTPAMAQADAVIKKAEGK